LFPCAQKRGGEGGKTVYNTHTCMHKPLCAVVERKRVEWEGGTFVQCNTRGDIVLHCATKTGRGG